MLRVGMVGLGFIGQTHFGVWSDIAGAQVVAVTDKAPGRVAARAPALAGNMGEAQALDLSGLARYTRLDDMLAAGGFDVVDVCLPTYVHADATVQALEAGYNVICEKPMALNPVQCDRMIAAAKANGKLLFIAHCVRFWPEYTVLAGMLREGELGRVRSMRLTRLSPRPTWSESNWIINPELSGGALLDLHIHDVDYMTSVLGLPQAVFASGASMEPGGVKCEHVCAQFIYDDLTCCIEGGWDLPGAYPFEMAFEVSAEKGCLRFSSAKDPSLVFIPADGSEPRPLEFPPGSGYSREMEYFVDCINRNVQPEQVTPFAARESVRLAMAEVESITSGGVVKIN